MNAPSRWTYVFAGLSMALAAFCVVQWRREATLRTELAEVGGQVAVSEKKAFDAAKLADTYAGEIRALETRVTELKKAEAGLKNDTLKATTALRQAEAGLLQAKADLGASREAVLRQNDAIRKQNTVISEQNDGTRRLNEAFKKVVDDRNEVVRLLNERTDMLNKLNAEKAGK